MAGGEDIEQTLDEQKTASADRQKNYSGNLHDDLVATVNNSVTEGTKSYPQTAENKADAAANLP